MSDTRAEIVIIEKIEDHPNADLLSIATVLGDYPVIVKRDEYKVGDICTYLSIDLIVPDSEQFFFLCPKSYEKFEENGEIKQRIVGTKYSLGKVPEKNRILKAKKIRNVYSMGMIIPAIDGFNVGDSVMEVGGFKKWEEENEENIPMVKRMRGSNAESPPKEFAIPRYDIENVRKYLSCIDPYEEYVFNEKLEGSNACFCHDGQKLWSRSRNWYKKHDPEDPWIDISIRYELENKISKYPYLAFFGELIGCVKGFRYDCSLNTKIRFFDIYDTKTQRYLDYDNFTAIIDELGLERVPELYRGKWTNKDEMYAYAEGMTTLGGKSVREGFVLKPVKERYEPRLNSRLILKLVGNGYNLQK